MRVRKRRCLMHMIRIMRIAFVLSVLLATVPPSTIQAQDDRRCFAETGFCISGPILHFWERNGGIAVFGMPKTAQYAETIEGNHLQVQWFERARLEVHPEHAPPFDVLMGHLGRIELEDTMATTDWQPPSPQEQTDGCLAFSETGYAICDQHIREAYLSGGIELDGQPGYSVNENMALFGLPLTPLITEMLEGRERQVQYFERARFELHPENPPPHNVQLGLLGNMLIERNQHTMPFATYADTCVGAISIGAPAHWPRVCLVEGNELRVGIMHPDDMGGIFLTAINTSAMSEEEQVQYIQQDLDTRFVGVSNMFVEEPQEQPDGSWQLVFSYTDPDTGVEMAGNSFYQKTEQSISIISIFSQANHFQSFLPMFNGVINSYGVDDTRLP